MAKKSAAQQALDVIEAQIQDLLERGHDIAVRIETLRHTQAAMEVAQIAGKRKGPRATLLIEKVG
jgi:hypothetical protein